MNFHVVINTGCVEVNQNNNKHLVKYLYYLNNTSLSAYMLRVTVAAMVIVVVFFAEFSQSSIHTLCKSKQTCVCINYLKVTEG